MLRLFCICALIGSMLASIASAATLPGEIDLAQAAGTEGTRFTRTFPGTGDGVGSGNQAIAVADFNNDGFDDMAIGYANYAPPAFPGTSRGRVVIVYGGETPEEQNIDDLVSKTVILNQNDNAQFGYALSAGDVTDDGLPDLLVGAPGARNGKGVVMVIENLAIDTPGAASDVTTDAANPLSGESRYVGEQEGSSYGASVLCIDTNGDGAAEIIGGAPNSTVNANFNAGKVYVAFGANYTSGMTLDIVSEAEVYTYLGAANSNLGASLAAGDLDGNATTELVIGAPGASTAYIVFAVDPGPNTLDLADSGSFPSIARLTGVNSLGTSIDSGDVDGDGFDDLLLGAPLYSPTVERAGAGGAIVYAGRVNLQGQLVDLDFSTSQPRTFELTGSAADSRYGFSVALGDVTGDGLLDFCVGGPFANALNTDAFAGRVAIMDGSYLPDVGTQSYDLNDLGPNVAIYGAAANNFLGAALNAQGDLDGDGFADLILTAALAPNGEATGTGQVHTLYGDGTAVTASATEVLVSGDTQRIGLGGALSPVVRSNISFQGGDGNSVTATITRNRTALEDLGNGLGTNVAPVYWNITTTRTGFTSIKLKLEYTDAEVAALAENLLSVYQADAPSGPWTKVASQSLDAASNRFELNVSTLGYFAIVSEAPVITLIGSQSNIEECGGFVYEEPGYVATAADGTDLTNTVVVTGGPVLNAVGDYTLTYNVEDEFGVAAEPRTRTIAVSDTSPPFFAFEEFDDLFCGQEFDLKDYFGVSDDCAGDLTDQVVISGDTVDFFTTGEYQIFLNVSDPSGNALPTVTQTIFIDSEVPPTIELEGEEAITLPCGTPFQEPGYSASDVCFGDLTSAVEITGTVDENVPGFYELFYQVSNSAQLDSFTRNRTIEILGPCAVEGEGEGIAEGEGTAEGEGAVEGEGAAEGEGEGEGERDATLSCVGDSVFSQLPDTDINFANSVTSEVTVNLGFDQFDAVNEAIGGVTWWGYDPQNRVDLNFRINFHADGETPGALLHSFTVVPNVVPTTLPFGQVVQYAAALPEPIELSSGWISIAATSSPSRQFQWWSSPEFNDNSRQAVDNGSPVTFASRDRAFCLLPVGSGEGEGISEGEGAAEGEGAVDGEGSAEGAAEGEGEGEPVSPSLECPAGSLYGHLPEPSLAVQGRYSDTSRSVRILDEFANLSGEVGEVVWWGGGFSPILSTECDSVGDEFRIDFLDDDGGKPGTPVQSYNVVAKVRDTGELLSDGRKILRYSAVLDSPITITDGWISVVGLNNTSCAFVWFASLTGNNYSESQGNFQSLTRGRAFCLLPPRPYKDLLYTFASAETSGDRLLTLAEIQSQLPEFTQEELDDADANMDGLLSVAELLEIIDGGVLLSVDTNGDFEVSLSELVRFIQLYNADGYACAANPGDSEDGFLPRVSTGTDPACLLHALDRNADGKISLSELLRGIQFYNQGSYTYCEELSPEDGFCP